MEYSKEFIDLLNTTNENLIGWGNPNAKILIIGCEPITPSQNLLREITYNRKQWLKNSENLPLLQKWLESLGQYPEDNSDYNPCRDKDDLVCGLPYYNPRFQLNAECRTWSQYQKFTELCLKKMNLQPERRTKRQNDFYDYCFVTDLSAAAAPCKNEVNRVEAKKSIEDRMNNLFQFEFFQKFPIIIADCGHYVRDYNIQLDELFKVPYLEKESIHEKRQWIHVHKSETSEPKILLHTVHFSSRVKIEFIENVAEICVDFATQNKIGLFSTSRHLDI